MGPMHVTTVCVVGCSPPPPTSYRPGRTPVRGLGPGDAPCRSPELPELLPLPLAPPPPTRVLMGTRTDNTRRAPMRTGPGMSSWTPRSAAERKPWSRKGPCRMRY